MTDKITRILVTALGGEGGGVLMGWIVAAARAAGHVVQASSIPGVAQRTGSTSYYVEVAPRNYPDALLGLVPMAGRVDLVVSSELLETARILMQGYISPERTVVVSSTARVYSTAEKIELGDGRYPEENLRDAVTSMALESYLLDLGQLARDKATFVSATMFGALAGTGLLPWPLEVSREVLSDKQSRAGFDAAAAAVENLKSGDLDGSPMAVDAPKSAPEKLPEELQMVLSLGAERTLEYQDTAYRDLFVERTNRLISGADPSDHHAMQAVTEAVRRLALWMCYEDIARVAFLKTRASRFQRIRQEVGLKAGQILIVTEYMKPRAEEIADILPKAIGQRMMKRAQRGAWFPFLGKGRYIRSNGIFGYHLLRLVAALKHFRRGSLRFSEEQAAIEDWLVLMQTSLARSPEFALALASLPRVMKGYSDTLLRGRRAYGLIMNEVVRPAINSKSETTETKQLQNAISAALADDSHAKLDTLLNVSDSNSAMPDEGKLANA